MKRSDKNLFRITSISLIVAFLVNIFNILMYGTNLESITGKTALIERFVDNDVLAKSQQVAELINNGIAVIKVLIVGTLLAQLITLLILNAINYIIAKRLNKKEGLFAYIATLAMNAYIAYYLISKITMKQDLIASLITLALLINLCVVIWQFISRIKPASVFMKEYFANLDYAELAYDFLKLSALLIIVAATLVTITKFSIYLMVANMIKQIDLASMINLSDYITIDLQAIVPEQLQEALPVFDQSVDLMVDKAFDTYVLDNVTNLVHRVLINFEGNIILNNIAIYLFSIFGSIAVAVLPSKTVENKNIVIAVIAAVVAVLCFAYIGSMFIIVGATGLLIGAGLLLIDLVK